MKDKLIADLGKRVCELQEENAKLVTRLGVYISYAYVHRDIVDIAIELQPTARLLDMEAAEAEFRRRNGWDS